MSSVDERVEQIWPSERDARVEAEVLGFVLEEHPGPLTVGELLTALRGASEGFARTDALQRAIRDLAGAGLLHREGATLTPTRAARRFAALEVD